MDNKRKYPRADLIFTLNYSEKEVPQTESQAKDISAGGVSFRTGELLEEGRVIHVAFSLEGLPGKIDTWGKVVRSWKNPDGAFYAALMFTEIDKSDQEIIENFIEDYLSASEG